jgi:hypothetical protein
MVDDVATWLFAGDSPAGSILDLGSASGASPVPD